MNPDGSPDAFLSYRTQFREEVDAIASALATDARASTEERLYKMIQYAIDRHDWYENQRHRFLELSLGLLAIAATLSPVLASLAPRIPILIVAPAALSLAWIALTALRIILIYSELIGPGYPYRFLADIRSWIFRYNFSAESSVPWLSDVEVVADRQIRETLDAFKRFKTRWLEFAESPGRFGAEDLEQVFILQLLQKYRADNLKRMTNVLITGTYVFLFLLFVSGFIYGISVWRTTVSFPQDTTSIVTSHRH